MILLKKEVHSMEWKEYKERIIYALDSFTYDQEIPFILQNSIQENQRIFIAGNGGSAAIANHFFCDLSKGANSNWKENKERYRVISLSSNLSYISAIANDESYDEIFKQQLINLAKPNDILILISSSGNSPNIVKAAEYGQELGMITVGISGFQGGKLMEICQYNAHIDTDLYEIAEDIHSVFGHFLAVYLREQGKRLRDESYNDKIGVQPIR